MHLCSEMIQRIQVFNDGGTHPNNILLWNYSFGDYNYITPPYVDNSTYASPTVVNGVVYEGSLSNSFSAFYANNGTRIWNFETDGDIHSSAAVSNNIIYFSSYDHNLYARNALTGADVWSADIETTSHSSPAVTGNRVYAGNDDGVIFAFDAASGGSPLWRTPTNDTPLSIDAMHPFGLMHSSPAVTNGVVYVGNENGNVTALYAANGTFIWNRTGEVY